MVSFGSFFGKKDALTERADTLVQAASAGAVSSFVPVLDRFPFLRHADVKHWDFVLTIAGVFIALTRLKALGMPKSRETEIEDRVSQKLHEWDPSHGAIAFEHCTAFFEKNFDALSKSGHDPRFVASDSIGLWMVWDILDRAPESSDEWKLVRSLGILVTHEFFSWWE